MTKQLLAFSMLCISFSLAAQPVITSNPQNATFCADSCATFDVSAVGNGLTYEWYATSAAGPATMVGTGMNLELCDSIAAYDGQFFYCEVSDNNGDMVRSDSAILTVSDCLPPIADFNFEWNQMEICFENTSQNAETVIWLFGDGNTDASNAQAPCHTYMTKELYFVKLRAFNDYGEDVIEKPIDLLSAEAVTMDDFQWYPNPAKDVLFLQHTAPLDDYQLMDLSGQLIQRGLINANTAQIDLSQLNAGVYFLTVHTGDDRIVERVIVE